MKLSDETVSVLKNYSTINQNLLIKSGSTLKTMSAQKNIVAQSRPLLRFGVEKSNFMPSKPHLTPTLSPPMGRRGSHIN